MKKFTLLIVPRLGGRIREFRLSILTVTFIVLIMGFGYVSLYLAVKGIKPFLADKEALSNLRAENERLEEQIIDMTRSVLQLKRKIALITEKEAEIRKLADIIEDSRLLQKEGVSRVSTEPELKAINSELESLKGLSTYYDSLFTRINTETGIIDHIPTIRPVCADAYISARFGMKLDPFSGKQKPHQGVDFAYAVGTPVTAAAGGTVSYAGKEKGFGKVVKITHGLGFTTMYAHLDEIYVREGQTVAKAQKIGTLGNTGRSIGPHLHYEVIKDGKWVDPETYF